MTPETLKIIGKMYDNEATDSLVYAMMAEKSTSSHNREVLLRISRDEQTHRDVWRKFADREPAIGHFRVWLYTRLVSVFGLIFVINLMESGEHRAVKAYAALTAEVPVVSEVLEDEARHEDELVNMIEQNGLSYISSIVLGLSDALVELVGALAGFTLALNDNAMISMAGFITGVAATLSMAASEYLSKKADPGEKHPLKAAAYTGMAYLCTVTLLLLPYAICTRPLTALGLCLFNAALIIAGFTYFVSVVRKSSFARGFGEMIAISFGVALISFIIGWAARVWLNLEL